MVSGRRPLRLLLMVTRTLRDERKRGMPPTNSHEPAFLFKSNSRRGVFEGVKETCRKFLVRSPITPSTLSGVTDRSVSLSWFPMPWFAPVSRRRCSRSGWKCMQAGTGFPIPGHADSCARCCADWPNRTIVDGLVSRRAAMGLSAVLLGLCLVTVVPTMMAFRDSDAAWDLGMAFSAGLGLCVSYTCWPLR